MNVGDPDSIVNDYKLLMSCTNFFLDGFTKEPFSKTIYLFARNDDINTHYKCCLTSLNHHITSMLCFSTKT